MPAKRPELPLRRASTLYLRIPRIDWAAVRAGAKTEIRLSGRGTPFLTRVRLPRPIVGYSMVRYRADSDQRLFVLEEVRSEPLGAITAESLRREGFDSIEEFRHYWTRRHQGHVPFKPLSAVQVFGLRPWRDGDLEELGVELLRELYGSWL